MKHESISLIIPMYNADNFIEDNILNIIKYKKNYDIELILIDDGSTDNTKKIGEGFSKRYTWIHYYKKSNSGVSSARNMGIEMAKGDWIYFIDADDRLMPDAIEKLFFLINNTDKEIIITGYDSEEKIVCDNYKSSSLESEDIKLMTLNTKYFRRNKQLKDMFLLWTCWGVLYKRSFIIKNNILFNEDLTLGEDIYFLLNCYDHCKEVELNLSKTYFYNNKNISLSKGFNAKRVENTKKLAKIYSMWSKKESKDIQKSTNKFIIERTLACISKYYLNSQNTMKREAKISDFENLCETIEIRKAIEDITYSDFFELNKNSLIYIISIFLLKVKSYRKIMKLYNFVKVY